MSAVDEETRLLEALAAVRRKKEEEKQKDMMERPIETVKDVVDAVAAVFEKRIVGLETKMDEMLKLLKENAEEEKDNKKGKGKSKGKKRPRGPFDTQSLSQKVTSLYLKWNIRLTSSKKKAKRLAIKEMADDGDEICLQYSKLKGKEAKDEFFKDNDEHVRPKMNELWRPIAEELMDKPFMEFILEQGDFTEDMMTLELAEALKEYLDPEEKKKRGDDDEGYPFDLVPNTSWLDKYIADGIVEPPPSTSTTERRSQRSRRN